MSENIYTYLKTATLTNDVNIGKLEEEIKVSSINESIIYINGDDTQFYIYMDGLLDSNEEAELDALVAAHEHITTAESLKTYLNNSVFPFVENLIATFAAENIALDITQSGKTKDVLALFEMPIDLGNSSRLVSLKGTFDTGSLYVSIDILNYHLTNIADYSDLTPFITTERLTKMKNDIETFLGVALT